MKSRKILPLALLMAMLVTSCAGTPTPVATEIAPSPEVPTPTEKPAASPVVQPSPTAVAEAGPSVGGVVRRGLQPPTQFDPAFVTSISEVAFVTQVYDYLVWVDEVGQAKPQLAESWESSADGKVWTFKLRKGVTFHDGSAFNADDVLHTFNRLRDPDLGAPTVQLYEQVEQIEKVDDHTVRFTLTASNPDFPYDVGDYHAGIVSSDVSDYATDFVGTGPFKVESNLPEDRTVFVRNDNYWMGGLPYLERLEHIYMPDLAAQVEALRGGELDFVTDIPFPMVDTLKQDPNVELLAVPTNLGCLIHMRSDRPPANDIRVRQALKAATDRASLTQLVTLGLGAEGRDTPIGPAHGEYYFDVPALGQDIEKAKSLLAEAGYPEGIDIELYAPSYLDVPTLAVAWQDQVAPAGIRVSVIVQPEDVYYGGNYWLDADFGITCWSPRPVPKQYLDLAYVCDAPWNESHWCDKDFDALAQQAAQEMDQAVRVKLYHDIQQVFMERGPIILPYFMPLIAGASPGLEGLTLHPTGWKTDFRSVYWKK